MAVLSVNLNKVALLRNSRGGANPSPMRAALTCIEAGVAGYFHFFQGGAVTAPGRSGTDLGLFLGAQVGYAFR